jgi:hypothetical protein
VNIPKRDSIGVAEIMLKSHIAKKMFERHSGLGERYRRGGFWNGYEHHESTGMIDLDESSTYYRSQKEAPRCSSRR